MLTMYRIRMIAACVLLAGASRVMLSAGKGDAAKGKAVFEQCAVCHNPDSDEKKMGPGLKGLFKKDKMTNGKKPTEAAVRARVDEGGQDDEGNRAEPWKSEGTVARGAGLLLGDRLSGRAGHPVGLYSVE